MNVYIYKKQATNLNKPSSKGFFFISLFHSYISALVPTFSVILLMGRDLFEFVPKTDRVPVVLISFNCIPFYFTAA